MILGILRSRLTIPFKDLIAINKTKIYKIINLTWELRRLVMNIKIVLIITSVLKTVTIAL